MKSASASSKGGFVLSKIQFVSREKQTNKDSQESGFAKIPTVLLGYESSVKEELCLLKILAHNHDIEEALGKSIPRESSSVNYK